jgi:hypothetical protein
MVEWILKNLSVVAVLVVFAIQVLRAMARARQANTEHEAGRDESAEARQVREVQEDIRRQIERRRRTGEEPVPPSSPAFPRNGEEVPVPRPHTTQMPEPFGGPLGRMLEELQKKAEQRAAPPPPEPPPVMARQAAELERQQRLTEQLRVLEESKMLIKRRATQVAAGKQAAAQSETGLLAAARESVLEDLRDPRSLRRAFVLREVLGPPVALR